MDFVSKNFQGTIQNDNLPSGKFYETWFEKPIDDQNHLMVNGYANSWVIDVNKVCGQDSEIATPASPSLGGSLDAPRNDKAVCVKNPDGTYDMEIVVEFWPQRLFYVGVGISGATLLFCLTYLGFDFYRRKKTREVSLKPLE